MRKRFICSTHPQVLCRSGAYWPDARTRTLEAASITVLCCENGCDLTGVFLDTQEIIRAVPWEYGKGPSGPRRPMQPRVFPLYVLRTATTIKQQRSKTGLFLEHAPLL